GGPMPDSKRSLQAGRRGDEALHNTLARLLQSRIDEGVWGPGAQLPSVRRLAEEFGASTVTVSRAVRLLSSRGVLHTHHGKGIFVAERNAQGSDAGRTYAWQASLFPPRSPSRLTTLAPPVGALPDAISLASGGVASDVLPTAGAH